MAKNYTKEEFNELLLQLLINLSDLSLSKFNKNDTSLNMIKKKGEGFEKPLIKTLDYSNTSTFLSLRFQETLKGILTSPSDFQKKTFTEKLEIQSELKNLYKSEYEWKNYAKRVSLNTDNVQEEIRPYYENFKKELLSYMKPTNEDLAFTQRAYKNYFFFKFKTSLKYLFHKMCDSGNFNSLLVLKNLTDEDYKIIVDEHIEISSVFNDLLKITVKKAHENLITAHDKNISYFSDTLFTYSHELFYESRSVLLLSFINSVLMYVNEKKKGKSTNKDFVSIYTKLYF